MWEELREELLLLHGHLRCSRLVQQGGGGAADTGDPQKNWRWWRGRGREETRAAGYLTFTHIGISREPISCKQVSMLVHYVGRRGRSQRRRWRR